MRIDDLNRTPVAAGTEKSVQIAQQHPPEQDGVFGSGQLDQAEVSHLAQSLSAADPGRVEQLRLQVQSGRYNVSAQTLASTLIDAHLKE
jgi:anti-sigma28 factor (negative regulator of flagellin synthesis)